MPRFHRTTVRGYYQTQCVECGKKALYHCGGDGYCRDHKHIAVARCVRRSQGFEVRAALVERHTALNESRLKQFYQRKGTIATMFKRPAGG